VAAVIDATLSGASANSYVTLAAADAYFETVPDSTTWTDKSTDAKKPRSNLRHSLDRRPELLRRPLHHHPSPQVAPRGLQD
jgi:hypothetical protein